MTPGLLLLSALRGERRPGGGLYAIAGPWVEYTEKSHGGHTYHGFRRHDATGRRVCEVVSSTASKGKWALWSVTCACSRCGSWVGRRYDLFEKLSAPDGKGWLSSSAALDEADRHLRRLGFELLGWDEVGGLSGEV